MSGDWPAGKVILPGASGVSVRQQIDRARDPRDDVVLPVDYLELVHRQPVIPPHIIEIEQPPSSPNHARAASSTMDSLRLIRG